MTDQGIRRAVWRAATDIPGLAPVRFAQAPGGSVVTFDGWSPTLHAVRMEVRTALRLDDPNATTTPLEAFLASQRRRGENAAAAGIDLPENPRDERASVRHLFIDASLAALALSDRMREIADAHEEDDDDYSRDPVRHLEQSIMESVRISHSLERTYDGGARLQNGGRWATEDGTRRMAGAPSQSIRVGRTNVLALSSPRHTRIRVNGRLPDTTLAAMAGRRLGDVVEVDAVLNARRIASTEETPSRVGITLLLEPLDALVGDLARMRASEAVEHLKGMIAAA